MTGASPARRMARLRTAAMVGLAAVTVLMTAVLVAFRVSGPPTPPLAAPVDPLYPDMGMAPLGSILVGQDDAGRSYLRFSATLVNVGSGAAIIAAHRPFPFRDDWRVVQRVEDGAGGYSEREIPARLIFGGDGHDHWHVVGAEAHQLETLDGDIVGGLVKSGFCFFDNVEYRLSLPGSPPAAGHSALGCGKPYDRDIAMGLSVGWGDEYQWYLLDQTIEITGVPDGRYRLRAIADPANQLEEADETNNDTWTIIAITTSEGLRSVQVVEQGPAG